MANGARQGEWRDLASGALGITAAPTVVRMRQGELRESPASSKEAGLLDTDPSLTGMAFRQGEMRNALGSKLAALYPGSGSPRWRQGDFRDSNNALLYVVAPGTSPKFKQGYLRDANGALIVTLG